MDEFNAPRRWQCRQCQGVSVLQVLQLLQVQRLPLVDGGGGDGVWQREAVEELQEGVLMASVSWCATRLRARSKDARRQAASTQAGRQGRTDGRRITCVHICMCICKDRCSHTLACA